MNRVSATLLIQAKSGFGKRNGAGWEMCPLDYGWAGLDLEYPKISKSSGKMDFPKKNMVTIREPQLPKRV
jgi:hypothetical protein